MKFKVMTYNIASCRNYKLGPDFRPITREFDPYIEALKGFAPDICGLNEVDYKLPRSCRVKMAELLGNALGYESAFAPAVTWGLGTYGNGFISKYPIKEIEVYPIPDPEEKNEDAYYETRVVLHTVVDMGGSQVDHLARELTLEPGSYDFDVMMENLKHIPNLEKITFSHTQLDAQQFEELQAAYENVRFDYTLEMFGAELNASTRELDLTNMTPADLDGILAQL